MSSTGETGQCPNCGGTDTVLYLFMDTEEPAFWSCFECDHEWGVDEDEQSDEG